MTRSFALHCVNRRPPLLSAIVVLVLSAMVPPALVLSASLARADDAGGGAGKAIDNGPASPVDEFSKQLEDFQKSVPDLNKSIQDSAGAIDAVTDVDKARAEIDNLRAAGFARFWARFPITARCRNSASRRSITSMRSSRRWRRSNRFKPEERQFLIDQWQQLASADRNRHQGARRRAGAIRRPLADAAASNEDFIGELVEIRQAEKAIEVIRSPLPRTSATLPTQLNKLIGGIKPPGV